MAVYDLYGFQTDDIDSLAKSIEKALGVKLQARSSDYWGDYFAFGDLTAENYELKRSVDGEGEKIEKKFSDYQSFFYLNESNRADEIRIQLENALDEINHLRRENI